LASAQGSVDLPKAGRKTPNTAAVMTMNIVQKY
jgi:hypothetical protein